ncbi:hypothetical protein GCM10011584_34190 [Nocardioides phosphati]|uniref:Tetratricopeptide repeat protein n=1 Tax=Nocardioides phosphati TaxID=1867775 RepID=A0ABQ2NGP5_9ACTN|nr:tetratricopeptide repeat protein [Nocardioides phosphati]GGO94050.1 hypothetical protein GCM10011584_34190 [Nocardioides phosphati]
MSDFLQLGQRLYKESRYADSSRAYEQALEAGADTAEALYGIARAAAARAQYDEALETLERARSADPAHPNVVFLMGWIHQQRGEVSSAIARFTEACTAQPGHREAEAALAALGADIPRPPAASHTRQAPSMASNSQQARRPRALTGRLIVGQVELVEQRAEAGGVGADYAAALQRASRSAVILRIRAEDGSRYVVAMRGVGLTGSTPQHGDWIAVPAVFNDGRLEVSRLENLETGELLEMRQPSKTSSAAYIALLIFVALVIVAAFSWVIYGFVTTQL